MGVLLPSHTPRWLPLLKGIAAVTLFAFTFTSVIPAGYAQQPRAPAVEKEHLRTTAIEESPSTKTGLEEALKGSGTAVPDPSGITRRDFVAQSAGVLVGALLGVQALPAPAVAQLKDLPARSAPGLAAGAAFIRRQKITGAKPILPANIPADRLPPGFRGFDFNGFYVEYAPGARDKFLTDYGRAWIYTQALVLYDLVAQGDLKAARELADGLIRLGKDEEALGFKGGWHFSYNTKEDPWLDPRAPTGNNLWALSALYQYMTASGDFRHLKWVNATRARVLDQLHLVEKNLPSLRKDDLRYGLVLGMSYTEALDSSNIDAIGYRVYEGNFNKVAGDVATEHQFDAVNTFRLAYLANEAAPRGTEGKEPLQPLVDRHKILIENLGRLWVTDAKDGDHFVTGIHYNKEAKRWELNRSVAVDNNSWAGVILPYNEEMAWKAIQFNEKKFVIRQRIADMKDLPDATRAKIRSGQIDPDEPVAGTIFFDPAFIDRFIADIVPPGDPDRVAWGRMLQPEATFGYIHFLAKFAQTTRDPERRDRASTLAQELLKGMTRLQELYGGEGLPYATLTPKLFTTLLSTTATATMRVVVQDLHSGRPSRFLMVDPPEAMRRDITIPLGRGGLEEFTVDFSAVPQPAVPMAQLLAGLSTAGLEEDPTRVRPASSLLPQITRRTFLQGVGATGALGLFGLGYHAATHPESVRGLFSGESVPPAPTPEQVGYFTANPPGQDGMVLVPEGSPPPHFQGGQLPIRDGWAQLRPDQPIPEVGAYTRAKVVLHPSVAGGWVEPQEIELLSSRRGHVVPTHRPPLPGPAALGELRKYLDQAQQELVKQAGGALPSREWVASQQAGSWLAPEGTEITLLLHDPETLDLLSLAGGAGPEQVSHLLDALQAASKGRRLRIAYEIGAMARGLIYAGYADKPADVTKIVSRFIEAARKRGIGVEILASNNDWPLTEAEDGQATLLSAVNTKLFDLDRIHLDLEVWTTPLWRAAQKRKDRDTLRMLAHRYVRFLEQTILGNVVPGSDPRWPDHADFGRTEVFAYVTPEFENILQEALQARGQPLHPRIHLVRMVYDYPKGHEEDPAKQILAGNGNLAVNLAPGRDGNLSDRSSSEVAQIIRRMGAKSVIFNIREAMALIQLARDGNLSGLQTVAIEGEDLRKSVDSVVQTVRQLGGYPPESPIFEQWERPGDLPSGEPSRLAVESGAAGMATGPAGWAVPTQLTAFLTDLLSGRPRVRVDAVPLGPQIGTAVKVVGHLLGLLSSDRIVTEQADLEIFELNETTGQPIPGTEVVVENVLGRNSPLTLPRPGRYGGRIRLRLIRKDPPTQTIRRLMKEALNRDPADEEVQQAINIMNWNGDLFLSISAQVAQGYQRSGAIPRERWFDLRMGARQKTGDYTLDVPPLNQGSNWLTVRVLSVDGQVLDLLGPGGNLNLTVRSSPMMAALYEEWLEEARGHLPDAEQAVRKEFQDRQGRAPTEREVEQALPWDLRIARQTLRMNELAIRLGGISDAVAAVPLAEIRKGRQETPDNNPRWLEPVFQQLKESGVTAISVGFGDLLEDFLAHLKRSSLGIPVNSGALAQELKELSILAHQYGLYVGVEISGDQLSQVEQSGWAKTQRETGALRGVTRDATVELFRQILKTSDVQQWGLDFVALKRPIPAQRAHIEIVTEHRNMALYVIDAPGPQAVSSRRALFAAEMPVGNWTALESHLEKQQLNPPMDRHQRFGHAIYLEGADGSLAELANRLSRLPRLGEGPEADRQRLEALFHRRLTVPAASLLHSLDINDPRQIQDIQNRAANASTTEWVEAYERGEFWAVTAVLALTKQLDIAQGWNAADRFGTPFDQAVMLAHNVRQIPYITTVSNRPELRALVPPVDFQQGRAVIGAALTNTGARITEYGVYLVVSHPSWPGALQMMTPVLVKPGEEAEVWFDLTGLPEGPSGEDPAEYRMVAIPIDAHLLRPMMPNELTDDERILAQVGGILLPGSPPTNRNTMNDLLLQYVGWSQLLTLREDALSRMGLQVAPAAARVQSLSREFEQERSQQLRRPLNDQERQEVARDAVDQALQEARAELMTLWNGPYVRATFVLKGEDAASEQQARARFRLGNDSTQEPLTEQIIADHLERQLGRAPSEDEVSRERAALHLKRTRDFVSVIFPEEWAKVQQRAGKARMHLEIHRKDPVEMLELVPWVEPEAGMARSAWSIKNLLIPGALAGAGLLAFRAWLESQKTIGQQQRSGLEENSARSGPFVPAVPMALQEQRLLGAGGFGFRPQVQPAKSNPEQGKVLRGLSRRGLTVGALDSETENLSRPVEVTPLSFAQRFGRWIRGAIAVTVAAGAAFPVWFVTTQGVAAIPLIGASLAAVPFLGVAVAAGIVGAGLALFVWWLFAQARPLHVGMGWLADRPGAVLGNSLLNQFFGYASGPLFLGLGFLLFQTFGFPLTATVLGVVAVLTLGGWLLAWGLHGASANLFNLSRAVGGFGIGLATAALILKAAVLPLSVTAMGITLNFAWLLVPALFFVGFTLIGRLQADERPLEGTMQVFTSLARFAIKWGTLVGLLYGAIAVVHPLLYGWFSVKVAGLAFAAPAMASGPFVGLLLLTAFILYFRFELGRTQIEALLPNRPIVSTFARAVVAVGFSAAVLSLTTAAMALLGLPATLAGALVGVLLLTVMLHMVNKAADEAFRGVGIGQAILNLIPMALSGAIGAGGLWSIYVWLTPLLASLGPLSLWMGLVAAGVLVLMVSAFIAGRLGPGDQALVRNRMEGWWNMAFSVAPLALVWIVMIGASALGAAGPVAWVAGIAYVFYVLYPLTLVWATANNYGVRPLMLWYQRQFDRQAPLERQLSYRQAISWLDALISLRGGAVSLLAVPAAEVPAADLEGVFGQLAGQYGLNVAAQRRFFNQFHARRRTTMQRPDLFERYEPELLRQAWREVSLGNLGTAVISPDQMKRINWHYWTLRAIRDSLRQLGVVTPSPDPAGWAAQLIQEAVRRGMSDESIQNLMIAHLADPVRAHADVLFGQDDGTTIRAWGQGLFTGYFAPYLNWFRNDDQLEVIMPALILSVGWNPGYTDRLFAAPGTLTRVPGETDRQFSARLRRQQVYSWVTFPIQFARMALLNYAVPIDFAASMINRGGVSVLQPGNTVNTGVLSGDAGMEGYSSSILEYLQRVVGRWLEWVGHLAYAVYIYTFRRSVQDAQEWRTARNSESRSGTVRMHQQHLLERARRTNNSQERRRLIAAAAYASLWSGADRANNDFFDMGEGQVASGLSVDAWNPQRHGTFWGKEFNEQQLDVLAFRFDQNMKGSSIFFPFGLRIDRAGGSIGLTDHPQPLFLRAPTGGNPKDRLANAALQFLSGLTNPQAHIGSDGQISIQIKHLEQEFLPELEQVRQQIEGGLEENAYVGIRRREGAAAALSMATAVDRIEQQRRNLSIVTSAPQVRLGTDLYRGLSGQRWLLLKGISRWFRETFFGLQTVQGRVQANPFQLRFVLGWMAAVGLGLLVYALTMSVTLGFVFALLPAGIGAFFGVLAALAFLGGTRDRVLQGIKGEYDPGLLGSSMQEFFGSSIQIVDPKMPIGQYVQLLQEGWSLIQTSRQLTAEVRDYAGSIHPEHPFYARLWIIPGNVLATRHQERLERRRSILLQVQAAIRARTADPVQQRHLWLAFQEAFFHNTAQEFAAVGNPAAWMLHHGGLAPGIHHGGDVNSRLGLDASQRQELERTMEILAVPAVADRSWARTSTGAFEGARRIPSFADPAQAAAFSRLLRGSQFNVQAGRDLVSNRRAPLEVYLEEARRLGKSAPTPKEWLLSHTDLQPDRNEASRILAQAGRPAVSDWPDALSSEQTGAIISERERLDGAAPGSYYRPGRLDLRPLKRQVQEHGTIRLTAGGSWARGLSEWLDRHWLVSDLLFLSGWMGAAAVAGALAGVLPVWTALLAAPVSAILVFRVLSWVLRSVRNIFGEPYSPEAVVLSILSGTPRELVTGFGPSLNLRESKLDGFFDASQQDVSGGSYLFPGTTAGRTPLARIRGTKAKADPVPFVLAIHALEQPDGLAQASGDNALSSDALEPKVAEDTKFGEANQHTPLGRPTLNASNIQKIQKLLRKLWMRRQDQSYRRAIQLFKGIAEDEAGRNLFRHPLFKDWRNSAPAAEIQRWFGWNPSGSRSGESLFGLRAYWNDEVATEWQQLAGSIAFGYFGYSVVPLSLKSIGLPPGWATAIWTSRAYLGELDGPAHYNGAFVRTLRSLQQEVSRQLGQTPPDNDISNAALLRSHPIDPFLVLSTLAADPRLWIIQQNRLSEQVRQARRSLAVSERRIQVPYNRKPSSRDLIDWFEDYKDEQRLTDQLDMAEKRLRTGLEEEPVRTTTPPATATSLASPVTTAQAVTPPQEIPALKEVHLGTPQTWADSTVLGQVIPVSVAGEGRASSGRAVVLDPAQVIIRQMVNPEVTGEHWDWPSIRTRPKVEQPGKTLADLVRDPQQWGPVEVPAGAQLGLAMHSFQTNFWEPQGFLVTQGRLVALPGVTWSHEPEVFVLDAGQPGLRRLNLTDGIPQVNGIQEAVVGPVLIRNGQDLSEQIEQYPEGSPDPNKVRWDPRATAAAFSALGRTSDNRLIFLSLAGEPQTGLRQATVGDMAQAMTKLGATEAILLGGSMDVQQWVASDGEKPGVLGRHNNDLHDAERNLNAAILVFAAGLEQVTTAGTQLRSPVTETGNISVPSTLLGPSANLQETRVVVVSAQAAAGTGLEVVAGRFLEIGNNRLLVLPPGAELEEVSSWMTTLLAASPSVVVLLGNSADFSRVMAMLDGLVPMEVVDRTGTTLLELIRQIFANLTGVTPEAISDDQLAGMEEALGLGVQL